MDAEGATDRKPEKRVMTADSPIVLIGVGNEFRTDDGLGPLIAREMRRRGPEGVLILETSGDGPAMIEKWQGVAAVLLVDAICSGAAPGTVHRFDASSKNLPRRYRFVAESHAFGLAEAIEMSRQLHKLPPTAIVYGIEGEQFETGCGLSDRVLKSVPELLTLIETDIRRLRTA
jgi:hydrogenase maturation protease